ncbi:hypothetical protein [Thiothrix subterranea]|uniref:Uncharacterized protein n=1 Tax=Thiothrix subterranea TaxID=2735563 RepID=A0AA51MQ02_9GAMM|nr:hypothetical protein [Thiothrix subterranea]MDQ5769563.1 hypothetical protein [Thiothrix subterranea]WML87146.1 hypothetical protein RCG00_02035 [Thiothrix subterranea]
MSNDYFNGMNRAFCEQVLNRPDVENRPGLKSLLQSRLCNANAGNISELKHTTINEPDGVIYMNQKPKNTGNSKQTIEKLNRRPIENMGETELLRELLSEIRALREVAQFGITKDEHEGKAGRTAMFDC